VTRGLEETDQVLIATYRSSVLVPNVILSHHI
jgi:hypothetical protein